MSIAKKIIGQGGIYFAGTVFSVVVGFFFKVYITRELGADALGIYALGMSVVAILSVFLSWGLGNGLVRFVSKYMAQKNYEQLHTYLRRTLEITLVFSLVSALFMLLFPNFIAITLLKTPKLSPYLSFFAFLLVINALIGLADHTIRGLQEVKQSTLIGQFIRQPIKMGIAVVLVILGMELRGYLWAEMAAAIIALILLTRLIYKLLPPASGTLLKKAGTAITTEERNYGNNMLIINTMGLLNGQADKILLALYLSTTQLGIYSVVLTITAFVPTILLSVNAIFTPIISQLHTENRMDELKRYYQLSTKYIFVLTFPLIVFLFLFKEPILSIFGNEFTLGAGVLVLILLGEMVNNGVGSVGMMLNMTGLEKYNRNVVIGTSILAIICYLIFIPSFGLLGLGVAKLLTLSFQNLINLYLLFKNRHIQPFNKEYFLTIVAFLILALGFYLIIDFVIVKEIFLILASFFFVYFIFIGLYFVIMKKAERILVLNLVKKNRR